MDPQWVQDDSQDSSISSSSDDQYAFIKWHLAQKGNKYLCEVDWQFLSDNFNQYGIKQSYSNFQQAISMILTAMPPSPEQASSDQFLTLYSTAADIYGLMHNRYIRTYNGLLRMKSKLQDGHFETCPRVLCHNQKMLPIGMSQQLKISRVKNYCPKCQEIYVPNGDHKDLDGAYFGCSFPHILLMTFQSANPKPMQSKFIPRMYGFKIRGLRGSKYEQNKKMSEINYYDQQQLKKKKQKNSKKTQSILQ